MITYTHFLWFDCSGACSVKQCLRLFWWETSGLVRYMSSNFTSVQCRGCINYIFTKVNIQTI